MSMAVHLNRPPHNVRLLAWGRAQDGWWACVAWEQSVEVRGERGAIPFVAWVPAGAVSRPSWSAPEELPRLDLPIDRQKWPAPPGWPHWYAGVWADGPVTAPAGVELTTGPAWLRDRATVRTMSAR